MMRPPRRGPETPLRLPGRRSMLRDAAPVGICGCRRRTGHCGENAREANESSLSRVSSCWVGRVADMDQDATKGHSSVQPAQSAVGSGQKGRQLAPATMTIFGAGGDLTKRLIVPALCHLVRARELPDEFAIIGVDHNDRTTEQWRQMMADAIQASAKGEGGDK